MQSAAETIEFIYSSYLQTPLFEQIQHVPSELYLSESPMTLQSTCLLIPYSTFDTLYQQCIDILKPSLSQLEHGPKLQWMAADILLCMNGENEKAWNFKRENLGKLDVDRELRLNGAICMKFKKSTVLYDFRLSLIKRLGLKDYMECESLLSKESEFIFTILKRFHRNYYCWTYRLKLFQYLMGTIENNLELPSDQVIIAKHKLVQLERSLVKQYCQKDIHQYSGFWYLFSLLKSRCFIDQEVLAEEMKWVDNLLELYTRIYSECESGFQLKSLSYYKKWLQAEKHKE